MRSLICFEMASQDERYGLTWVGKQAAAEQAYEPARARLVTETGEPLDANAQGHLFIEGDNLTALKLLLPDYESGVKLIYIDPPYNTGHQFVYMDHFAISRRGNFRRERERVLAGALPSPDEDGRFHARWLSMMYPLLILARRLLRSDGAIFVSIGSEELHTLLAIMYEIFSEACFKNVIVIRRGMKSVQAQFDTISSLNRGHEYLVAFTREPQTQFAKLVVPSDVYGDETLPGRWNNHWRGTDRPTMRYPLMGITPERGQWRWARKRSLVAVENFHAMCAALGTERPSQAAIDAWVREREAATGERIDLIRRSTRDKPEHYIHPTRGQIASDLWLDIKPNGPAQLRQVFGKVRLFDSPKSPDLVRRLITLVGEPCDVVLDFFAGSATTAQAIIEANAEDGGTRRFICVQAVATLPESVLLPDSKRLLTIADIGRERIRRVMALREHEAMPVVHFTIAP